MGTAILHAIAQKRKSPGDSHRRGLLFQLASRLDSGLRSLVDALDRLIQRPVELRIALLRGQAFDNAREKLAIMPFCFARRLLASSRE